jgi:hypothetical protein
VPAGVFGLPEERRETGEALGQVGMVGEEELGEELAVLEAVAELGFGGGEGEHRREDFLRVGKELRRLRSRGPQHRSQHPRHVVLGEVRQPLP